MGLGIRFHKIPFHYLRTVSLSNTIGLVVREKILDKRNKLVYGVKGQEIRRLSSRFKELLGCGKN